VTDSLLHISAQVHMEIIASSVENRVQFDSPLNRKYVGQGSTLRPVALTDQVVGGVQGHVPLARHGMNHAKIVYSIPAFFPHAEHVDQNKIRIGSGGSGGVGEKTVRKR
jgi:hypothetical protein